MINFKSTAVGLENSKLIHIPQNNYQKLLKHIWISKSGLKDKYLSETNVTNDSIFGEDYN